MIDNSSVHCFNCPKLGHFTRECNYNKKEPQENEARVARQEFGDENTFLVMIIEEEYISSSKLQDNNNSSLKNAAKP